eukprot:m.345835 g.345835  ORF g.345835 m.345835 type:complete len:64 (-) comp20666_c0_seq44:2253-2444(-)
MLSLSGCILRQRNCLLSQTNYPVSYIKAVCIPFLPTLKHHHVEIRAPRVNMHVAARCTTAADE